EGMLGPFGKVVSLTRANKLLVQDTAGNLRRIVATIKDVEDTEKAQGASSFSHTCQYIKARDAEKILRDLLGDPKELLRASQPETPRGFGGGFLGGFTGGRPAPTAAAPANAQKIRMHYISIDEGSNTVLVTGPADKLAQAAEIMKRIDV